MREEYQATIANLQARISQLERLVTLPGEVTKLQSHDNSMPRVGDTLTPGNDGQRHKDGNSSNNMPEIALATGVAASSLAGTSGIADASFVSDAPSVTNLSSLTSISTVTDSSVMIDTSDKIPASSTQDVTI